MVSAPFIKQDNGNNFLLKSSMWKGAFVQDRSQNLMSSDKQQNSEIPSYPSEELDYIPLTNRGRGPYCKLRTEFFPARLWPKREVRGP